MEMGIGSKIEITDILVTPLRRTLLYSVRVLSLWKASLKTDRPFHLAHTKKGIQDAAQTFLDNFNQFQSVTQEKMKQKKKIWKIPSDRGKSNKAFEDANEQLGL